MNTVSLVIEGKTKKIYKTPEGLARVYQKEDITAGDGEKHDKLKGKDILANITTCNVFELLKKNKIPLAYKKKFDTKSFIATMCDMLPYEVVVRGEAQGSYLKRHPDVKKGEKFSSLKVEFFLKTDNKQWKGMEIPVDDPLIQINSKNEMLLFRPDLPVSKQEPFLVLNKYPLCDQIKVFGDMGSVSMETFSILSDAWSKLGSTLVDYKVEFGFDSEGALLLSDVIDNDSWRLINNGKHLDKQLYRDGGELDTVIENYRRVAELTKQFKNL